MQYYLLYVVVAWHSPSPDHPAQLRREGGTGRNQVRVECLARRLTDVC